MYRFRESEQMDLTNKQSGPIGDIINSDAFEVHGLMFSIKEIIQCAFLCSSTLSLSAIDSEDCNAFMFTINKKDAWIMGSPVVYNIRFNECVLKNNTDPDVIRPFNGRNTYINHNEDTVIMMITKGFVVDNFEVKESYHDFLLNEGEPHVMIDAEDIESLSLRNPTIQ